MDEITLQRIKLAHPNIRLDLTNHYIECNNLLGKGVRLRFTHVYRSPQEQNKLFKQKPKVTNAKGGQSIHNYGLAFDIVLLYDKNGDGVFETVSWDMVKDGDNDKKADWMEVTNYFKSKGYEWGGDWKSFKDYPHFQKAFGLTWQMLKNRVDIGMTILDSNIVYPKI